MNRLAFQTYGTKKLSLFQSVWNTTQTSSVSITEKANIVGTGTNWAPAGTTLVNGGYNHTTGSAAVLQFGLAAERGQSYQMKYTVTGTGSVTINFGGVSSAPLFAGTDVIITMTPITTATLSITPLSTFVGNISLSIKQSSSAANQIQLPITVASGKSIWVDWGDGQYSTMNSTNFYENRIHTYTASGDYSVRVFGDDFNFGFGYLTINDKLKIKSISSWGKLKIGESSFLGCSNVTMSGITDIPDLTGVTSLSGAFYDCREVTTIGRINEWNTSSLINASELFRSCHKFNSDISNWNVSNVTNMTRMLYDARVFNQPIGNWERSTPGNVSTTSKVTSMNGIFSDARVFNQPIGNWDVSNVTTFEGTFRYAYAFNQNLSSWNVTKSTYFYQMFQNANSFNNGFASGVANQLPWTINTDAASVIMSLMFQNATAFNSNLGTGTTPWNVSKVTTFEGMFYGASNFRNGDDTAPINNWNIGGNVTSVVMTGMFRNAIAFNRNISSWNMTKVTTTNSMFQGAIAFNQPLSNWERSGSTTGNITNMQSMFQDATAFNQNIGNWDVRKVTNFQSMFQLSGFNNNGSPDINNWVINTIASVNMSYMFNNADAFNQPIGSWNVSSVTNMSYMFGSTTSFNQPLSNWNVSNVTNMSSMFASATAFNQPLSNWNVSNVTNMSSMFASATAFNQDISSWNVGKVTIFTGTFSGATAFNNGGNSDINPITLLPGINGWNINTTATSVSMNRMFAATRDFNRNINDWNVSKVTDMNEMFIATQAFNQPINSWNTVSVLGMVGMFEGATAFNQPIDNWNMTNVTATRYMFNGATIFNQPLSNWERVGSTLANVTSMNQMFQNAVAFNQPIGNWNVSNVANFIGFMNGKTSGNFSSTNLDAIYNGWGSLPSVKPNTSSPLSTNISFGSAKYSQAGKLGKDTLLASPNNWRIADGLLTVSGTSSNGGLIRVTTTSAHLFVTGNSVYIYGVVGTTNANGTWTVTNVNTTTIELQGSTYNAAWTGGGNIILP